METLLAAIGRASLHGAVAIAVAHPGRPGGRRSGIIGLGTGRRGGEGSGGVTRHDLAAIVAANVLSFLLGEVMNVYGWFGLFR